jgi:hypothetical protein
VVMRGLRMFSLMASKEIRSDEGVLTPLYITSIDLFRTICRPIMD